MFPLPDTAQLYYFPKSGDTKTAERTRRHLYRSYDLDMAKIRKFFESANFSAFFSESAGEGVEVALRVEPKIKRLDFALYRSADVEWLPNLGRGLERDCLLHIALFLNLQPP